MATLLDDLKREKDDEARLRAQQEEYRMKVELASALISGLADEKGNWQNAQIQLKQDSLNLIGDVIICSGIIAYLGIFIKSYRDECIT